VAWPGTPQPDSGRRCVLQRAQRQNDSCCHGYDHAGLIQGSRLVPLDSANHLLPEQDPAWPRFLGELDAFLGSAPRSQPVQG